jgi:phage-related protein (TIGR01555 family)
MNDTKKVDPGHEAYRHEIETAKQRLDTQEKTDGWVNFYKSMNVKGRDAVASTDFLSGEILVDEQLSDIYSQDGLGKRIVDTYPNEMTKNWFTVEGDPESAVLNYLSKLRSKKHFNTALKWAFLYGAGFLVLDIDDGGSFKDFFKRSGSSIKLQTPVNENNIKTIKKMWSFDRSDIIDIKYYDEGDKFGEPEFYTFQTLNFTQSTSEFTVHESRVISLNGEEAPNNIKRDFQHRYRGFGIPFLQIIYNQLKAIGVGYHSISQIMHEFIIGIMEIDDLASKIAAGQESQIVKRMDLINIAKSLMNSIIIDTKETFTRDTASVAGLDKLIEKLMQYLSGATGIPVSRLFGRAAAGLNATGENEQADFNDEVRVRQENQLEPGLRMLIDYIALAKDFKGSIKPGEYEVNFNPLEISSEKEVAEIKKATAETDQIYIQNQVLTPDEVAISRFGGDSYSTDTVLQFERTAEEPEESEIING